MGAVGKGYPEGLGDRLRRARNAVGLTQEQVESLTGIDHRSVSRWEMGAYDPHPLMLRGLASIYGVSFEELSGVKLGVVPGFEPPDTSASVPGPIAWRLRVLSEALSHVAGRNGVSLDDFFGIDQGLLDGSGEAAPALIPIPLPGLVADRDVRPVDVVLVAAAAGGGVEAADETPVGRMWFGRDWLRENGINVSRCKVISVVGDSMSPVVPDGSSILLDLGARDLRDGCVYVVRVPTGLVVKRASVDEGVWRMVSDSPGFDPIPIDDVHQVVGRVRCVIKVI